MTGIMLKSIKKTYQSPGDEKIEALRGIDLHVQTNQCVAIMGPSGSGKSTLLHVLAGLLAPTEGTYLFDDIDVYKLKERKIAQLRNGSIGLVSQDFALMEDMSAFDNVVIPMLLCKAMTWKDIRDRGRQLLVEVGLDPSVNRPVSRLSGGQRQRVAISRARALAPKLLLCDEPTANLDGERARDIMDLLLASKGAKTTVLIATHDVRIAQRCDYTITLRDGCIDII